MPEKFIDGSRPMAPRLDIWEQYKQIIIENYRTMKAAALRDFMVRSHNFPKSVTVRQFVHRLHIWNERKNKRNASTRKRSARASAVDGGSPQSRACVAQGQRSGVEEPAPQFADPPYSPVARPPVPQLRFDTADGTSSSFPKPLCPSRLGFQDARSCFDWAAEMLFALGDPHHAFGINCSLWEAERLTKHVVACVRTAQTEAHAGTAREILGEFFEVLAQKDVSLHTVNLDLLGAHTYKWGQDAEDGICQAEQILKDVMEDGQGLLRLKELKPLGAHLDIPTYVLLASALVQYNQRGGDDQIDVHHALKQFIDQQRVAPCLPPWDAEADPLLGISSLPSCVEWCVNVLRTVPAVPLALRGTDSAPLAAPYVVLCTLWHLLLSLESSPPSSSGGDSGLLGHLHFPGWAAHADPQLGISPTELLSTVVCMIIAAAPRPGQDDGKSVLERALAGAEALKALGPADLVHRFINQVWAANQPLIAHRGGDRPFQPAPGAVDVGLVEICRRFVAESLRIDDLPPLEHGAAVYPLVVADPDAFPYDYRPAWLPTDREGQDGEVWQDPGENRYQV